MPCENHVENMNEKRENGGMNNGVHRGTISNFVYKNCHVD